MSLTAKGTENLAALPIERREEILTQWVEAISPGIEGCVGELNLLKPYWAKSVTAADIPSALPDPAEAPPELVDVTSHVAKNILMPLLLSERAPSNAGSAYDPLSALVVARIYENRAKAIVAFAAEAYRRLTGLDLFPQLSVARLISALRAGAGASLPDQTRFDFRSSNVLASVTPSRVPLVLWAGLAGVALFAIYRAVS